MPALRAARMENEDRENPKEREPSSPSVEAKSLVPGRADLEKDVAVDKQAENFKPGGEAALRGAVA